MKNKEKYAKEIAEIACEGSSFGIDKHAVVIMSCRSLRCSECSFYMSADCDKTRKEWADSEYVERPVISKGDRAFLDYFKEEYNYIARNKNGKLFLYRLAPYKEEECLSWIGHNCSCLRLEYNVDFPMIKWEDNEPWLIGDLKKLEVVDEY